MRILARDREEIEFAPPDAAGLDLLIILCGCRRACADKEDYKSQALRHLIIAGASLDGSPSGEKHLAALIADRLGAD